MIVVLVTNYPVRTVATVSALISVLPLFGVPLTAEQVAGLNLVIATFLGVKVHDQVTPTIRLGEKGEDDD